MNYPVKRDLSFTKIIVYNITLCFIQMNEDDDRPDLA